MLARHELRDRARERGERARDRRARHGGTLDTGEGLLLCGVEHVHGGITDGRREEVRALQHPNAPALELRRLVVCFRRHGGGSVARGPVRV